MAVYERGDVVSIYLGAASDVLPDSTPDAQLFRPALVITPRAFNRLGETMIAPIIQSVDVDRYAGFAYPLAETGMKTQGFVLFNKLRLMDLVARKTRKIERAPQGVMQDVRLRLLALLGE